MAVEQFFDAEGRLDVEVNTFDGGGYARIDYDQAGSGPWRANSLTYDSSNRLVEDLVISDTGASQFVYYDASSAFSWSVQSVSYDATGRLALLHVQYDNGFVDRTERDTENLYPWSEVRLENRRGPNFLGSVEQTVVYDDGSSIVSSSSQFSVRSGSSSTTTLYAADGMIDLQTSSFSPFAAPSGSTVTDYDLADQFPWRSVSATTRGSVVTGTTTVLDGGGRIEFELSFGAESYATYDAQGRPITTARVAIDGSGSSRAVYDQAGAEPWTFTLVSHDGQGRQLTYSAVYDDGAQDWSYYDVNNVQPWSAASSHRDAGSNRVDWRALLDDGTVISGFDLV